VGKTWKKPKLEEGPVNVSIGIEKKRAGTCRPTSRERGSNIQRTNPEESWLAMHLLRAVGQKENRIFHIQR